MPCFTYILYSQKLDKYYIGQTCTQLKDRLKKHNTNHKGYTGKANDWQVVFKQSFETRAHAIKREREIKGWKSRKKIEQLLNG